MLPVIEIAFALVITFIFIRREEPKFKFLLLGYFVFLIALVVQIPVKLLLYYSEPLWASQGTFIPLFLAPILSVMILSIAKYTTLKNNVNTKSAKNAILFVIGFVTLESIPALSSYFYEYLFGFFGIHFNYDFLIPSAYNTLAFFYFFIINLSVSIFIVMSIMKKSWLMFIYAMGYSFFITYGLNTLVTYEYVSFIVLTLIYSSYVIFKYKVIT